MERWLKQVTSILIVINLTYNIMFMADMNYWNRSCNLKSQCETLQVFFKTNCSMMEDRPLFATLVVVCKCSSANFDLLILTKFFVALDLMKVVHPWSMPWNKIQYFEWVYTVSTIVYR